MDEDSSFFLQYSLDYTLDELRFDSVSAKSYPRSSTSFNGCSTASSSSQIISFGNSNSSQKSSGLNPKIEMNTSSSLLEHGSKESNQGLTKNEETKRGFAQDHVLAERKRREKLNQRFIALSSLIPGLKKNDKASVLGDAIAHLMQLQERLRELEEQATKKKMESVVLVKKACLFSDDGASSEEESTSISDQNLPEIEARVSDKDVLVRIHYEKQKGLFPGLLNELEKLSLSVVHSSVLKFGNSTLDITIVAKMEDGFSLTMEEMAKNLRNALQSFISAEV